MSTNKETKGKQTKNDEEIVDAKETTAVATTASNAVAAASVKVEGVSLRFPFVRVGQAMSQWRCDGRAPEQGAFYIGKDKTTNVKIAEAGEGAGITGILLGQVLGYAEDKPFTGAANPPRRFFGDNALEEAQKAGLSLEKKPTGAVYPDSGNPVMRASLSPFCILQLLIPVSEDFGSMEFQLFPIGDKLYTPGRIEFGKMAFAKLNDALTNIKRVDEFRHRGEEGYAFSLQGRVGHIFTKEAVSKQTGNTYPALSFDLAVRDGKPFEFTPAEKEDFTKFLMSIRETEATVDDVNDVEA